MPNEEGGRTVVEKTGTPLDIKGELNHEINKKAMNFKKIGELGMTCCYFQVYGVPGFERREK